MADSRNIDLRDIDDEDFDTIIAADIKFSGKITFSELFLIKGSVNGQINATGDLVVDANAVVEANIVARRVLIRGKVNGNITAESLVFICKNACLEGNLEADEVVIEQGAFFSGNCKMRKK